MIDYRGRVFDDMVFKPYSLSRRVASNFYQDECEVLVVHGMPEGVGKSAYVNHVLADLKGYQKEKDKELLQWMWKKKEAVDVRVWESDWEQAKPLIMYPPEEIVKRCKHMLIRGEREMAFHWDDAGTWLNAMEWHDPFVVAFMEYLSLARSNWGAIILSTPVEEWVLKKLRTATGVLHVPIIKLKDNFSHPFRPRRATCYKIQRYPNKVRSYWNTQFRDDFSAIMPTESFYRWYKPRRDQYAFMATVKMDAALKKRKEKGADISKDESVLSEIRKHIDRANDEAEDFSEVVEQKSPEAH